MRARGGIGPAARFPAPSLETWPITSAHESKRFVQENATRLKKAVGLWRDRDHNDRLSPMRRLGIEPRTY